MWEPDRALERAVALPVLDPADWVGAAGLALVVVVVLVLVLVVVVVLVCGRGQGEGEGHGHVEGVIGAASFVGGVGEG